MKENLGIQSPSIQIGALVGAFSVVQYDQYSNTPGFHALFKLKWSLELNKK
jgi:hypothetical protein